MLMCQLREFRRQGAEPEMDETLGNIKNIFSSIKAQCKDNTALRKDFEIIEKPLAFFIDYTIKESEFSFAGSWREMGREYGELSGDEKFFDMLADSLDDPNAMDRIEIFYIMMGLGFHGMYKKDPETIERKMKVCAARMPPMADIAKTPVTPRHSFPAEEKERERFFRSPGFVLALSVFFAFCSLLFNYYIFDETVKPFQRIIDKAANEPTLYIGFDNMSGGPDIK